MDYGGHSKLKAENRLTLLWIRLSFDLLISYHNNQILIISKSKKQSSFKNSLLHNAKEQRYIFFFISRLICESSEQSSVLLLTRKLIFPSSINFWDNYWEALDFMRTHNLGKINLQWDGEKNVNKLNLINVKYTLRYTFYKVIFKRLQSVITGCINYFNY